MFWQVVMMLMNISRMMMMRRRMRMFWQMVPLRARCSKVFQHSPLCLIFEGQPTNPWNHPGLAFNFLPKYIQLHSSLSLRVHYLNQDKDQHQGSRIRIMFNTSASTLSLFLSKHLLLKLHDIMLPSKWSLWDTDHLKCYDQIKAQNSLIMAYVTISRKGCSEFKV